jgi:glycosyltransferase involved in cell wall biosynthesis
MVFRSTDLFVWWSTWADVESRANNPELASRMICLHPGIDLDRWPRRDAPPPPTTKLRLLFVGGDLVRKGIETLLQAFEQSLSTTCELRVATSSAHLALAPAQVRTKLATLPHVSVYCDLTPGSEELQRLYRESDVLVLPTNNDVSSWVSLEAMATGLPVIASAIGGIPDIVIDGVTGFLIPPQSPDALVRAVEVLQRDSALCARMGMQARAHVERNFDAKRSTERLLTVIKGLIDSRTAEIKSS